MSAKHVNHILVVSVARGQVILDVQLLVMGWFRKPKRWRTLVSMLRQAAVAF